MLGESNISGRRKRDEPFNPFAKDATAQRNKRQAERSAAQQRRGPTQRPQQAGNDNLAQKRKEALERLKKEQDAKATPAQAAPASTTASPRPSSTPQKSQSTSNSREDRLAELRRKSMASKMNAASQKNDVKPEVKAEVTPEVKPEVKVVEAAAPAVEAKPVEAVAKSENAPSGSAPAKNVFKTITTEKKVPTNDRRRKRRPHAKKGGGRQKQEKRLNRQKYLEYKYAAKDILDNPSVAEQHRSNVLGQVWAKGERMSIDESIEFIEQKELENILPSDVADALKSLVRKMTTKR